MTEAVAIATTGVVYTSIHGLRQLHYPSIWSFGHDTSCLFNCQGPGALHEKQMAVYECTRRGDGMICSVMRCESICRSPILADNREVLEHRYGAKQHLVHTMWGTHKVDLERGMLMQRPMLDITCSNRYQVQAQVDKVKSCFMQSARDNIVELFDLHCFESNAEYLELIDSLLVDNKYLFLVAKHVEGGVCIPNPVQRESTAANKWPPSTLLPG